MEYGEYKGRGCAAGICNERGKPFTRQALAYMLKNQFYSGKGQYGDIETCGTHKALISPNLFRRIQKALDAGNKHKHAA